MARKYVVTARVNGRVRIEVEADNEDEAQNLANDAISEMDFGELEDIDWETVYTSETD